MTTHILVLIHISLRTNLFLLLLFLLLLGYICRETGWPSKALRKYPGRLGISKVLLLLFDRMLSLDRWKPYKVVCSTQCASLVVSLRWISHQNILFSFGIQTGSHSVTVLLYIYSSSLVFLQTLYLIVIVGLYTYTESILLNVSFPFPYRYYYGLSPLHRCYSIFPDCSAYSPQQFYTGFSCCFYYLDAYSVYSGGLSGLCWFQWLLNVCS